jgi:GMP synthase-like glutamine amidotransferase
MTKIYIVNGSAAYNHLFLSMEMVLTADLNDADMVAFTGGEDVTPSLYGDAKHPYTGNNVYRDTKEAQIFEQCLVNNTPCAGICRGAQFLNVMSGGRMYQHVEKHVGSHTITDLESGETIYVSSTHHQMMMPSPRGLLVASSTLGGAREWYDGEIFKKDVSNEDIEVVFYEHTKCLCFQPHPEFHAAEYAGMRDYFSRCVGKYLKELS